MDQIFLSSVICKQFQIILQATVKNMWNGNKPCTYLNIHPHICAEHQIVASSAAVYASIQGCLAEVAAATETSYDFSDW